MQLSAVSRRISSARGQVAQMVERSPEKAGVGGSIPSLATIISKNLVQFNRRFPVRSQSALESRVQSHFWGRMIVKDLVQIIFSQSAFSPL